MNKTALAAVVLAAAMIAGCTDVTDKSGGEVTPTILVMASNDGTETRGAPGVARFVELVADLSQGRLQVEMSPDWGTRGEQRVLEDVAAGKAVLGWSGTRAFDTIGTDAFRPLHAPFLIDSYAAQKAVVGDHVAQDMLTSLNGSGLTGLALLADELRFPAGAEGPLLDVSDFEGLNFGIMPSNVQSAAMTALGARVKAMSVPHPPGTDGLEGLETSWPTYLSNDQQGIMPFVTANAVLWPRTTVIVANTDALDQLPSEDRDVITRAAIDAARWSVEHVDDQVADEITQACKDGARIATATPRQLADLAQAVQPAYAAMRGEPEQAALLTRIEGLVRDAGRAEPVDVPEGCGYQPGDENRHAVRVLPAPLTGPGRPGKMPAGTYRYTLTEQQIREGVDMGAEFADANAGVWTWTLGDGRWSYELKPSAQTVPEGFAGNTCEGYYDVDGNRAEFTTVTVYASGECASKTWKADWRETEKGLLMRVTTDAADLDFLFGAEEWERIR